MPSFDFLAVNFFIYAVIGYLSEVLYCSLIKRSFVNRGFLYGPYCPIYGFGALMIIIFLKPFKNNFVIVFILGLILASILEYFTSWALEKLFSIKLWDYSKHKININGRVCLLNSTLFGLMGLMGVYVVDPFLYPIIMDLEPQLLHFLGVFIVFIFTLDTTVSVIHLKSFQRSLLLLREKAEDIRNMDSSERRAMLLEERDRIRNYAFLKARHFISANPSLNARSAEMRLELDAFRDYLDQRSKIRKEYKSALKENRENYKKSRMR